MVIVEKSKDNLKKCICMSCPSYTKGCKMRTMPKNMLTMIRGNLSKKDHFEGLFCAFEKSNCLVEEKGCICATCDVYKENKLNKLYYCTQTGGK